MFFHQIKNNWGNGLTELFYQGQEEILSARLQNRGKKDVKLAILPSRGSGHTRMLNFQESPLSSQPKKG
jgi:hypothetical protein